jgi:hypothetical protein
MHLQLPFVGNRRSKELHKATCYWAKLMRLHNVRLFESVGDAQGHGYNGCAFCLPQYNTG